MSIGKEAVISWLNSCQISKRLDLDRDFGRKVPDRALTHHGARAFANRELGMACVIYEAEVGHVGLANIGRRPPGLERFKAARG